MMTVRRPALLCSALAAGLYGCAGAGHDPKTAEFKVVPRVTASEPTAPSDGLYLSAVAAIRRRDYAQALEVLQAARERAPNDARVLNAFGVVYDKLGRFDLSSRYYAQAQAADPGSQVVAQNLAYSKVLQGETAVGPLAAAQTPSAIRMEPQAAERVALAAAPPALLPKPQPTPLQPPSHITTAAAGPRSDARPAAAAAAVLRPPTVAPIQPVAVASATPATADRVTAVRPVRSIAAAPVPQMQWLAAAPVSTSAKAAPAPMAQPRTASAQAAPRDLTVAATFRSPVVTKVSLAAPSGPTVSRPSKPAARPDFATAPHAAWGAELSRRDWVLTQQERSASLPRPNTPLAQPGIHSAVAVPHSSTLHPAPAVKTHLASLPHSPVVTAAQRTRSTAQPVRMGKPVKLVFSASQRRTARQLQALLSRRGWTLVSFNARSTVTGRNVIRYDPAQERIAIALARSLRIPVKLERCWHRCSGVTLFLSERPRTVAGQGVGSKRVQLG